MDFEKIKENMLADLSAYPENQFSVMGLRLEEVGEGNYHSVGDGELLAYPLPDHVVARTYPASAMEGLRVLQTISGSDWNRQYRDHRDAVKEIFGQGIYRVVEQ